MQELQLLSHMPQLLRSAHPRTHASQQEQLPHHKERRAHAVMKTSTVKSKQKIIKQVNYILKRHLPLE